MAREPSVLNNDESGDIGHERANTSGNGGLLHRRSYLKLAGTATAAAAVASAAGSADEDEYEVWEADNSRYFMDEGETLENVIIDFSNGNWFQIQATGVSNFTIRNVAFVGTHRHDEHAIIFSCSDEGLIENVYMGDGCVRPSSYSSHGQCGIFGHNSHSGHVTIRNVNVQGWPNNGMYTSSVARSGGTVSIEECYGANNYVSTYRIADGSEVRDSVAYNDGGRYSGRCLWAYDPGTSTCDGCNFDSGPYNTAVIVRGNATLNLSNTTYDSASGNINGNGGNNANGGADLTPPEGVPMTAEEAVSAEGGSGGITSPRSFEDGEGGEPEDDWDHVYTIYADEDVDYYFEAQGDVEFRTGGGNGVIWDEGPSNTLAGTIPAGEFHAIHHNELVADVDLFGEAHAFTDTYSSDLSIYPRDFASDGTWKADVDIHDHYGDESDLENVILFDGEESGATRYEFVVDGDVEKSTYEGASIDDEDVIEDDLVHGVVADWRDAFRFSGDLEQLTVDGPGTVTVNGEEVDPSEYGEDLPHVLTIEGRGVPTSYEITVDGSIELVDVENPEDDATTVSGSTAQSSITDGTQEFHFSGAVTDVTFSDGKAAVFVDDEEVDTSEYGDHKLLPHAIVVDGTEAEGASAYSFSTSGKVIKSDHLDASIDDEDIIDGRAVRGVVSGWLDAYWFDGDVEDLLVLGDASAHVLYNARDQ
ncbi:right-handed parallel beta-helix repeat-containing protein [Halobacteria archaeon AArc-dxtr1]|nr:right-handed parallel beta-helix repeat-containing protein [Halobacteria archaeon AArc-dxtr1]